jgi:hypothetical protein
MFRPHRLRRWAAWLALAASFAGALVPTLARAIAAADATGRTLVEVCTGSGLRMLTVAADADAPAPRQPTAHLDACPYCTSAGHSPALLGSIDTCVVVDPSTSPALAPARVEPSSDVWPRARSRAPPARG